MELNQQVTSTLQNEQPRTLALYWRGYRSRAWDGPEVLPLAPDREEFDFVDDDETATEFAEDAKQTVDEILDILMERLGSFQWTDSYESMCGVHQAFDVVIHDLGDVVLSTIDCQGSGGGPLLLSVYLPRHRRHVLRPEFASELVSYLRFLANFGPDEGLTARITTALKESSDVSIVLSFELGYLVTDTSIVMGEYSTALARAVLESVWQKDTYWDHTPDDPKASVFFYDKLVKLSKRVEWPVSQ